MLLFTFNIIRVSNSSVYSLKITAHQKKTKTDFEQKQNKGPALEVYDRQARLTYVLCLLCLIFFN